MTTEVRVPTLGESVTEATVATWFKKPGDSVAVDEMLCELETDKVTVEVPSPAAGSLGEIVAAEGETVGVDALLATIAEGAGRRRPGKARMPPPLERPQRPNPPAARRPSVDVMVPTLGESVTEATVCTWFKKVGDTVAAGRNAVRAGDRQGQRRGARPAAGTLSKSRARRRRPWTPTPSWRCDRRRGRWGRAPAPRPTSAGPCRDDRQAAMSKTRPPPRRRWPRPASRDQVTGTGRDGRIMKEDVPAPRCRKRAAPAPSAPAPAAAPRAVAGR